MASLFRSANVTRGFCSKSFNDLIKFGPLTSNPYVYELRLNDDKTRNCLSHNMVLSLKNTFMNATKISECKVILLNTNETANVFCSGHDLKNMLHCIQTKNESEFKSIFNECNDLFRTMQQTNIPIIASLNGIVTASGIELASFCDIVLSTKNTKFSIPGTLIGLAAFIPTINLIQNLNHIHLPSNGYKKLGLDMLFTANVMSSDMAYKHGFINKICDDYNDMMLYSHEYANKIASKNKNCVGNGKEFFYKQLNIKDIHKAYNLGSEYMVKGMLNDDTRECITAFLDKRKPIIKDTTA